MTTTTTTTTAAAGATLSLSDHGADPAVAEATAAAVRSSLFSSLPPPEGDEAFVLTALHNVDENPNKVNLGAGTYRDGDGNPWVLPVVRKVATELVTDLKSVYEYLPIRGHHDFLAATQDLMFGVRDGAFTSKVASVQTISGTGACHLGARFLSDHLKPRHVWISDPTWGNHHLIWNVAGKVEQRKYPYYNAQTLDIDFERLIACLEEEAVRGDVIILHACAHNPTGLDPSQDQWKALADLCLRKGIFPFFDSAYQGFASGNVDLDAWAVRHFVDRGMELCVAQTFSKSMGLYSERVGALHVVTSSEIDQRLVLGMLEHLERAEISNPPGFGAKVVSRILHSEDLRKEWLSHLEEMATRIGTQRKRLHEELTKLKTPGQWDQILRQTGMFSYTGLSKRQVTLLREQFHLYIMSSGRIAVPALNDHNIEYVAKSIDHVVRETL